MSDDSKPPAVWLFHPSSGQVQQVSASSWASAEQLRQTEPDIEGGLHGWFLATPEQAAMGAAIKLERLAAQAPPAPADDPAPARRAR